MGFLNKIVLGFKCYWMKLSDAFCFDGFMRQKEREEALSFRTAPNRNFVHSMGYSGMR